MRYLKAGGQSRGGRSRSMASRQKSVALAAPGGNFDLLWKSLLSTMQLVGSCNSFDFVSQIFQQNAIKIDKNEISRQINSTDG